MNVVNLASAAASKVAALIHSASGNPYADDDFLSSVWAVLNTSGVDVYGRIFISEDDFLNGLATGEIQLTGAAIRVYEAVELLIPYSVKVWTLGFLTKEIMEIAECHRNCESGFRVSGKYTSECNATEFHVERNEVCDAWKRRI